MRLPLILFLPLFLCGALCRPGMAQEQERKLMDRIERPDMTLSFGAQKKEFFGSKSFQGAGSAQVKAYTIQKNFRAKDFLTGSYSGQKGFWMGDFKYATKEGDTVGRGGARAFQKEHATKAMPVKESREAKKEYATRAMPTRATEIEGRSQYKLDTQGEQALATIRNGSFTELKTIDDIRDLLNKNE